MTTDTPRTHGTAPLSAEHVCAAHGRVWAPERLTEPIVRYADLGADEPDLDEFIAHNADIHVEAMGPTSWWIGVTLADGRMWHINLGAENKRVKFYAVCEEQ